MVLAAAHTLLNSIYCIIYMTISEIMRAKIDRDGCICCGTCWNTCPEFFEQNPDDTHSQIAEKYRVGGNISEGEAPDSPKDMVRRAADLCPVQIIHVK